MQLILMAIGQASNSVNFATFVIVEKEQLHVLLHVAFRKPLLFGLALITERQKHYDSGHLL